MTGAAVSEVAQSADTSRRKFLVGATAALSAVGVVGVATPFVASGSQVRKPRQRGRRSKSIFQRSSQGSRFALSGVENRSLYSVVLQKCLRP